MSEEVAEVGAKRKRYKTILDPNYNSSMLSMKSERAWYKSAEEKLRNIKERMAEKSNDQALLKEGLHEKKIKDELDVLHQDDLDHGINCNKYDGCSTDDETDDENFQNMAHHNNNSCSINLEETLVKENIPTSREEILRNDPTIVDNGQWFQYQIW
ncbi:uncharacterized protein LOC122505298 isoform X2 [Leptopilina heterotoma]|uniref:uncharacterized protein LOC122505298 isoform X2 n=1 Tax=Leptopilina heterotoma TaxID=63436 RepID=UPI001CA94D15|nr:uncharacterized protein LOC122505298 isoform X2 [Leptopilina heterotoma]